MTILVTGSSGHLGEAMMRRLAGRKAFGLDKNPSPFTTHVGSVTDRGLLREVMTDVDAVVHAATLHKPHVATHNRQDFVDVNVTGTLSLLEEAIAADVTTFVFSSTTSVFGDALRPPPGAPAAWITEEVRPAPKNIYGVTKTAAEDLVALFHRNHGLNGVVLRLSRFFPEEDDDEARRNAYAGDNAKANEYLYRRVDLEDAVDAHLLALECAPAIGFDRFIISATTPFRPNDLADLREHAPDVVRRYCPEAEPEYRRRSWAMFPTIDRVYVNHHAREALGWRPRYDFATIIDQLRNNQPIGSQLAQTVGAKGYHDHIFADGPYPVEPSDRA